MSVMFSNAALSFRHEKCTAALSFRHENCPSKTADGHAIAGMQSYTLLRVPSGHAAQPPPSSTDCLYLPPLHSD
jgi:hypothetical protein